MPATSSALSGENGVPLERMADNPWEPGYQIYRSGPVAALADLRAAELYSRTQREAGKCTRCDLPPGADEILSGHTIALRFPEELRQLLSPIYGSERLDSAEVDLASVPWDTSPSLRQEPTLNPSYGTGDVVPGTLLHSGEMSMGSTDLYIKGRGFDFAFTRTYRNQTVGAGPLGPGFDHSYNRRLRELPGGDVEYYDGRGRRELFARSIDSGSGDVVFRPPAGRFWDLKRTGAGWVLVDQRRNLTRFDRFGRLISIADFVKDSEETGSEMRFFYDLSSNLVRVEDTLGRDIHFDYDPLGRLVGITDFDGRHVGYKYDGHGRLVSVTSPEVWLFDSELPEGLVTSYAFPEELPAESLAAYLTLRDDLDNVTDPAGQTWLDLTFSDEDGDGRPEEVSSQRWGEGTVSIAYSFDSQTASVTNRRQHTSEYTHSNTGQVVLIADPTDATWAMGYDEEGLEILSRTPQARETHTSYEDLFDRRSRGNPTRIEVVADPRGANGSDPILVTTVEYENHTNQPVRIVDPRGIVTEIDRNELGLPERITRAVEEPESSTTRYDYNEFGQVVMLTNPNANITTFDYFATGPSRGYLERKIIDPDELALTTRYETDARGNVTAVIDPRGVRHERKWNALDWLEVEKRATTAATDGAPALSYSTHYGYDADGNLAELERPFGDDGKESTLERYEYGILDELLVTRRQIEVDQDEEGWTVEYREYDPQLNLTLLTEPDGQKTEYVYEVRDLLVSVTYGLGSDEQVAEIYGYEPERQQTSFTDGRGHTWTTDYDGYARVKARRDPLENRSTTTYDNNGNPIEQISFDGTDDRLLAQMSNDYDKLDRSIATTEKLWQYDAEELGLPSEGVRDLVTETKYDPASNVVKTTDALGRETTYEYDTAERLVQVTDPIGNRTRRVLDPASNVLELHSFELVPEALGGGEVEVVERMTYDAVNRTATHADALDNTTTYRYDARDNLRFTVDPLNYETQQVYDGLDRRIASIRPSGIRVNYLYDKSSRLRAYYDALDNATNYQYDALNRRTSTTWPDDTVEILEYDHSHNVRKRTDPNSTVIHQDFDESRRLATRTIQLLGGAIGPESESFTYDGLNRTTLGRSGEIETHLTYDSLSRLLSDTTIDRTLTYDYDDEGNVVGIGYPSGLQVRQAFDDLNRPLSIGEQAGEDFNEAVSYGYRGPFLQVTTDFPNGIHVERGHDGIRRRLSETARSLLGFSVFEENLTWSPRSLKTSESRADLNGRDRLFGYDGASRVTQTAVVPVASDFVQNNQPTDPFLLARLPEGESMSYDEADNLTSRIERRGDAGEVHTMPLDGSGRNRPGSIDGQALIYDANGNMTSKGARNFSYDFRNRLTRVGESGQEIATYTYDAFNRRVSKLVDGETQETVWGGWRPLEEYRDGQLTSRRTYGSGLDEIVRTERDVDGDGTIDSAYAPLYDETGNLALLTLALAQLGAGKPAAEPSAAPGSQLGQPVERYSYSAYGERRIFVDSLGPAVEQVRTLDNELLLEISEEVLFVAFEAAQTEERLTLLETATGKTLEITLTQPVTTGRQAGRRLLITPSAPPSAGTELLLTLPADALRDSFANTAAADFELTFPWQAGDEILLDNTPPRLEQVFLRDGQLEIVFSEEPDLADASATLQIDSQSVDWTLEEDRYTLRTTAPLDLGAHALTATTAPLDLAGLGLVKPFELAFEVHEVQEECSPDTICATVSAPALLYEAPDSREISTSATGNDFGFHGLPHDPETGFVYMRNRYYDPELGRFISADPLGYVDGPSLYGFAGNTPYNSRDPLGLERLGPEEKKLFRRAARAQDYRRKLRAKLCQIEGPLSENCLDDISLGLLRLYGDRHAKFLPTIGSGKNPLIYVHGINTPPQIARDDAKELSGYYGRSVEVLWNPSQGRKRDVLQTTLTNKPGLPDATTKLLVERLKNRLQQENYQEGVTIVAHSQGAAIVSSALSYLTSAERARVSVITYGGAAYFYPGGLRSLRVIVNVRDCIPWIAGASNPIFALQHLISDPSFETMSFGSNCFKDAHKFTEYLRNEQIGGTFKGPEIVTGLP